jgi:multicomponent Na+:H+ antiporter subunit E
LRGKAKHFDVTAKRPDAMNSSGERQAPTRAKGSEATAARAALSAMPRFMGFLGFWLILTDAKPADVPAGVVTAVLAAWASLSLMPRQHWEVHPFRLIRLVLRFFSQTAIAGLDVAWRALDPRLPLRPGIVIYSPLLPEGTKRNTLLAIMSLMPGTLPSGPTEDGGIAIHCLDTAQPVIEQLRSEELAFVRALGGAHDDD